MAKIIHCQKSSKSNRTIEGKEANWIPLTHVHHRSFSYLGPEINKNDDVQDCCHICYVTIYVVLSCSVVDV